MALSKKWQIEKWLLDDMIANMEQQEGYMFSKDVVISWLNSWNKHIK